MNRFINQKVNVKKRNSNEWVSGIVESISQEEDGLMSIKIDKDNDKLVTPIAVINGSVVFEDKELQNIAVDMFSEFKKRLEEKKEAAEEASIAEKDYEYSCRQRQQTDNSNVAIKCTFCDGGMTETQMGYRGPCSPSVRKFNIKHRTWCQNPSCRCFQLENSQITQKEFDEKAYTDNKEEFLCYESRMLIDWVCYSGMASKTKKPMALNNAQVGFLAVMTFRPLVNGYEVPQEKTQIFGVFLIAKHNDNSSIGGSVSAHEKYRIELTPQESKKMLLWKYHSNRNAKDDAAWGSGLFRYLSDMECCQILKDIVDVVEDPNKKALAKELLEKYQKETGIQKIEEPSGVIA